MVIARHCRRVVLQVRPCLVQAFRGHNYGGHDGEEPRGHDGPQCHGARSDFDWLLKLAAARGKCAPPKQGQKATREEDSSDPPHFFDFACLHVLLLLLSIP